MLLRVTAVSLVMLAACAQGQAGGGDDDDVDASRTDAKQDLVDAPIGSVDARIDAPSGAVDGGIDAPPGAAPDTCGQAQDITAGAMMANGITVTGNTTGYADDVNLPNTCTIYSTDGPDAIYAVTVNAGAVITAVATPTAWDVSLELIQPCALTGPCLVGRDDGFGGDPETITYTATQQGTYFVVVDGYNPGVAGPYSLNVRVQ
jgi:hypothetical protein